MSVRIKLRDVRLAFPSIWRPTAFGSAPPAYSAVFILPPEHPDVAVIRTAISSAATAKWGTRAQTLIKSFEANNLLPLRNGDGKPDVVGFPGNLYLAARSSSQPVIVGPKKEKLEETDGKPYAGCYVNAVVDIWPQDNQYGRRINAALKGVQFVKDGPAFASEPLDLDEFDVVTTQDADDIESLV